MKRASLISLFVSLLILSGCVKQGQQSSSSNDENQVYAVVNGVEIKGKEVVEKVKEDLSNVERKIYDIKRQATEELIQQKILEEEAKKQGVTIEKLFSQFDNLRDREVNKDDIKNFLKERGISENKLSKQDKDTIPQIIKMRRVYEARQKYVGELRSKANVQLKLSKPEEKPVTVGTGQGPALGKTDAKVTIVEFSDFQCPYCAEGRRRVHEIAEKYKDKVKIHFRHFPLEQIHPQAFKASEASICAQDQNKFWEYHDAIFDNQGKLRENGEKIDSYLVGLAKDLKLDDKAFAECLKSGKNAAKVRADMEDANKIGVNSTPSFFVNGLPVRGAVPLQEFSQVIEDELAKK